MYWSELDKNFFDSSQYAGYGNIGHIMELIWLYKDKQLIIRLLISSFINLIIIGIFITGLMISKLYGQAFV